MMYKYVTNIINRGAFSNVYKSLDIKSKQYVAIKIIRKYELNRIQVRSLLKMKRNLIKKKRKQVYLKKYKLCVQ